MGLATYLEFVYEFQWRREEYTGQIQINVSEYPVR